MAGVPGYTPKKRPLGLASPALFLDRSKLKDDLTSLSGPLQEGLLLWKITVSIRWAKQEGLYNYSSHHAACLQAQDFSAGSDRSCVSLPGSRFQTNSERSLQAAAEVPRHNSLTDIDPVHHRRWERSCPTLPQQ